MVKGRLWLPVSLSGEVAEARRSRVARSAIVCDAVGALDVGGAASHTARRPLAWTIASTG